MKLNISLKDVLFLKRLVTPTILTYLYWLSCVGIILFALTAIFNSFRIMDYYGLVSWLSSFLIIIISTLVLFISTRIGFELLIVIFNINDNLKKIAEQTSTSTKTVIDDTKQD